MKRALIRGVLAGALVACTLVFLACGGRSGRTGTDPGFSVGPVEKTFWQQSNAPGGTDFRSLLSDSHGYLFAASSKAGVFRSADQGQTWVQVSAGLTALYVHSLATSVTGNLFAGTNTHGVFRSVNGGTTWSPAGLETLSVLSLLASPAGLVFAGTNEGVFRSDDDGGTWLQVNNGMTHRTVLALAIGHTGSILAGTEGGGVYITNNSGGNWQQTGLTTTTVQALHSAPDAMVYAATSDGVYRSTDGGSTWSQQNTGLLTTTVRSVVADVHGQVFVGTKRGVFRSLDHGSHWQAINEGLGSSYVRSCLLTREGYLVAGTLGGGIYRSVHPTTKPG